MPTQLRTTGLISRASWLVVQLQGFVKVSVTARD
jgi:hypothetical protein